MYDELRRSLWSENSRLDERESGLTYDAAIVEQYKLYVESTDRVSYRRGTMNTYFLSINSLIAVVIGTLWANPPDAPAWFLVFPLLILEGTCVSWYWMVRSYRQLNTGKLVVVGLLEERLPASPWSAEWTALGKGEDRSLYWPLTHLEQWIPVMFGATYIGAFVAVLMA